MLAGRHFVSGFIMLGIGASAQAAFNIPTATGPFAPSFRGDSAATYFGWSSGTFDGTPDNELIDSPPPTLPVGGPFPPGVNLVQNHGDDILSSTNNIYTGGFTLDLTITAPTAGTPSTGFTTLIVQGKTAFGAFGSLPVFAPVEGVSPSFVVGLNATAADQFFVKYEVPGNAATYDINVTGGQALSINTLTVDTYWSANGYAPDLAVVPEPASLAALSLMAVARRRRS